MTIPRIRAALVCGALAAAAAGVGACGDDRGSNPGERTPQPTAIPQGTNPTGGTGGGSEGGR